MAVAFHDSIWTPWEEPSNDVYIIGAGFSIATNNKFLNTDALGTKAARDVRRRKPEGTDISVIPKKFTSGNFETYLGQISEDQPYLSTSENLRNRAVFFELTKAVRDIVVDAEQRTDSIPDWFYNFISVCHARQSKIITLNYDTLIERSIPELLLTTANESRNATASDILDGIPPNPKSNADSLSVVMRSFRLIKLHGSTWWFWVPADLTGSTIQRIDPQGYRSESSDEFDSERRRLLPGREPFIIPPISGKGSLYLNPVIKELWSRASHSLKNAKRIFVVGYSFPQADTGMIGLLQSALSRLKDYPEVHVIDRTPSPIIERLGKTGISATSSFDGASSVKRFADSYTNEAAKVVVERLRRQLSASNTSAAFSISWGNPRDLWCPVDGTFEVAANRHNLIISTDIGRTNSPDLAQINPDQMKTLVEHLAERKFERILFELDGKQIPIVNYTLTQQTQSYGGALSLTLIPAGKHPENLKVRSAISPEYYKS